MARMRSVLRDVLFYSAAAGMLVSGYVTFTSLFGRKLVCIGTSGCGTVQASVYAHVWGVPVAAVGFVAYVALALLASRWSERGDARTPWLPLAALGLTITGTLFSGYLTALEVWVLQAYCSWCLVSAALQVICLGVTLGLLRAEAVAGDALPPAVGDAMVMGDQEEGQ